MTYSYPLFLSHIFPFRNQNETDSNALGLSTCLVTGFEITVPPCCCRVVISTFRAILPLPADPPCLKTYISAFLSKMSSHLVPKFEIVVLPHFCAAVISKFRVILPPPVDPACLKICIAAFFSKMLVLDLTTF